MEYKKNFSLFDAYDYLNSNGLEKECEEIKNSSDKYRSYSSTLRRAKIILLVRDKKLLDDFCKTVWISGITDKGKSRIKFFENLVIRFNSELDGTLSEEEEEEITSEESEFAYEKDLQKYLVRNLSIIEKGLKLYQTDGVDGEGVGFSELSNQNKELILQILSLPHVKVIEVWQGHLNEFMGFRDSMMQLYALARGNSNE